MKGSRGHLARKNANTQSAGTGLGTGAVGLSNSEDDHSGLGTGNQFPFHALRRRHLSSCCAPWSWEKGNAENSLLPTFFSVTFLFVILKGGAVVSYLASCEDDLVCE